MKALDHTGNRIAAGRCHRRKIADFALCKSSPPVMRFRYRSPPPGHRPATLEGMPQRGRRIAKEESG
ncbi:MAG TPA: hypothetical protein VJP86_16515 [Vicinamibacterales bacterium]|nr:hypothetical protein [Vicinamibacterales bacterium]